MRKLPFLPGVIMVLLCSFSLLAAAERSRVAIADSPRFGPPEAPVTIVEFIDFT